MKSWLDAMPLFLLDYLLNATLKIVWSHGAVFPSSRGYQSQQIDLVKLGMKAIIIQLDGPFDSDRQWSTGKPPLTQFDNNMVF